MSTLPMKYLQIGSSTYEVSFDLASSTSSGLMSTADKIKLDEVEPMSVLSYGNSTWADFLAAYQSNSIVYCRASSQSNPASGSQTRMAFLAYVNDATSPTEVEFQYYRSVSTHTESQQGDQVFVYKLNSSGTWSVTTREASAKIVAGTGLDTSYSNDVLTVNHENSVTAQTTQGLYPIKIDAQGHISDYGTAVSNISAFTNDAGYITSADVPQGASAYTGTIAAVSTVASNGTSNGFARGDHVHNITSNTITSALGYTPLSTADVASVLHYKGTKATVSALPSSGNAVGDVWHVSADGSEHAWDGSAWQELGTAIDLSNYVTNVTVSTVTVGSASTGSAISADDITGWTTNTPTQVSFNTVVTGGSTTSYTPITKKTVVTGVSTATVVTGGSTNSIKPITKKTVVVGGSTVNIPNLSKKTVVTSVTPANVVTGGSTTSITPVTKKTVVTSVTPATVVTAATMPVTSYSSGVLSFVAGSVSTGSAASVNTGDSVTNGTAVTVYNALSTGAAATVSTGDSVNEGTAINVIKSLSTGDSVTEGSSITVYSSLTTGPSATVTTGDSIIEGSTQSMVTALNTGAAGSSTNGTAASLSYTAKTIPNISVTNTNVVSTVTVSK